MIVVDTSAIVAIALGEHGRRSRFPPEKGHSIGLTAALAGDPEGDIIDIIRLPER
jgi:hypothetical protein